MRWLDSVKEAGKWKAGIIWSYKKRDTMLLLLDCMTYKSGK